ncbi:hypothetical protein N8T08_000770 [Aspergillus melleus]|uniref:Uncharacterized protein n=1 Tax=Aspergillus melleus TaxID=138277 RepID=A0ACC3AP40_9EURO|nr:hypothetical protein N8T08_000770 [Aspergillus melleus]
MVLGDPNLVPERLDEAYLEPRKHRFNCDDHRYNPIAYPMHERCWALMTRIVDVKIITAHLREFCQVMWQTRQSIGPLGSNTLAHKYHEEPWWPNWRRIFGDVSGRCDPYYEARFTKPLECTDRMYALRDPWKVPEIWTAINREKKRWLSEKVRRPRRRLAIRPTLPLTPKQRVLRPVWRNTAAVAPLPPELTMIIIEYLRSPREVRLLMWVFPRWAHSLPALYWRRLFIREMILDDENDQIPGPGECHWRRLFYGIDRIAQTSHGLRNRQRILAVLETTGAEFMDKLGNHHEQKRKRRCPEGVVAGVWNSILGVVFCPQAFFTVRPEEQNALGFSDLTVHCKGAAHEGQLSTWERGIEQLADYLYAEVGNRQGNDRTAAYGAIAVGRLVKFFKFSYTTGTVRHWYPGHDNAPYMIGRDCKDIQLVLDYILEGQIM